MSGHTLEWDRKDHDVLIELHSDVKYVRKTLEGMEADNTRVHGEHDGRLRVLEDDKNRVVGKRELVGGFSGLFAGGVGAWIIAHFH
jgi:hypothetical protein